MALDCNSLMICVQGKTLVRGLTVISNLWTITKSFCPPYDFAIPELREKYLKEYQLFPDDFFKSVKNDLQEARALNLRIFTPTPSIHLVLLHQ